MCCMELCLQYPGTGLQCTRIGLSGMPIGVPGDHFVLHWVDLDCVGIGLWCVGIIVALHGDRYECRLCTWA